MKRPRSDIKPDPLKTCTHCGTRLRRKRYRGVLESMLAFRRRKFCNRTCMAAAMVGMRSATPDNSRRQSQKTAKQMCEWCGTQRKGRNLHVHHLDGNPFNNAPMNLVTLCVKCHQQAHSPYFDQRTRRRLNCLYCEKPSVKTHLCNTHLTRKRKYGDPRVTSVYVPGAGWTPVRQ